MKEITILAILGFFGILNATSLASEKLRFDNFKVYRFVPETYPEVDAILSLENKYAEVNFWKRGYKPGLPIDVMIPPHLHQQIFAELPSSLASTPAMIENIQELIDLEEKASGLARANTAEFGWEAFYDFDYIMEFLDNQTALHPSITSLETYGTSFEQRPLKVIKISTGGNGNKPVIFIDGGIHAREWISSAVATYLINELLNGEVSGMRGYLDTFDFHIAPMLNPDGYMFSRLGDRTWRKTRSNHSGDICRGADPNRNWDFYWNGGGSSDECIMENFHGVAPFSEQEMLALSTYLNGIAPRTKAYLSLHCYGQQILIPFGTWVNGNHHAPDHENLQRIGNLMTDALATRFGTQYDAANFMDYFTNGSYPVASGSSVDWVKGVHPDVTVSYIIELRDRGYYGFLTPPGEIRPIAQELIDGLQVLFVDLKIQLGL